MHSKFTNPQLKKCFGIQQFLSQQITYRTPLHPKNIKFYLQNDQFVDHIFIPDWVICSTIPNPNLWEPKNTVTTQPLKKSQFLPLKAIHHFGDATHSSTLLRTTKMCLHQCHRWTNKKNDDKTTHFRCPFQIKGPKTNMEILKIVGCRKKLS